MTIDVDQKFDSFEQLLSVTIFWVFLPIEISGTTFYLFRVSISPFRRETALIVKLHLTQPFNCLWGKAKNKREKVRTTKSSVQIRLVSKLRNQKILMIFWLFIFEIYLNLTNMLRYWWLNFLVRVFVCIERISCEEILDLWRNLSFYFFDCFGVILKLINA